MKNIPKIVWVIIHPNNYFTYFKTRKEARKYRQGCLPFYNKEDVKGPIKYEVDYFQFTNKFDKIVVW
ncbi:MAG: hypothetical protein AABY22_27015 [Nanoarchaeota archaeon]